ncbi:MAG: hypothetical protein JO314_00525 [Acidobacteria bacterium]|nr:hypothetical protein [Acidobacteriota bacterium]
MADCFELSNGTVKVTLASEFGPRILGYSFLDGPNVLGWHPEAKVETSLGTWYPRGGHRLWIAPENNPVSYAPDNDPIEIVESSDLSLTLRGRPDAAGNTKQMTIRLAESGSEVTIDHTLTVGESREAAAWALTIMAPGGTVVIPNEPFAPYSPDHLLPVRSMALWSYTDFTDPRWEFAEEAIRLRVDESHPNQQKIGVLNRQAWAAYEWHGLRFEKRVEVFNDAAYPDYNSNFEFYTAGGFVEIETLSPLRTAEDGGTISHREVWKLA